MLLKKLSSLVFVLLITTAFHGQEETIAYFKLLVFNEDQEILLVNYKDQWEPAGKKYTGPHSMRDVLTDMAAEMGVEIDDHKLQALITKFYGKSDRAVIYHYISAKYCGGNLKAPPGCTDIRWFEIEEALEIIPFEAMNMVLDQIFHSGESLWAGSLRIFKDPDSGTGFVEIIEDFHRF